MNRNEFHYARKDEYGDLEPVEVSRREQFGPFGAKRKRSKS